MTLNTFMDNEVWTSCVVYMVSLSIAQMDQKQESFACLPKLCTYGYKHVTKHENSTYLFSIGPLNSGSNLCGSPANIIVRSYNIYIYLRQCLT